MNARWLSNPVVRRALRSLALWSLGQLALMLVGRLAARRLDRGDETSTDIRRVYVMSGEELRPTDPGLSRVRVDAVMGGAQLDLTALPPARGGVDVVVRTLMGGVAVRIPKGWTTWWSYRGAMGGVGADAGVQRVNDPAAADLRVRPARSWAASASRRRNADRLVPARRPSPGRVTPENSGSPLNLAVPCERVYG